eukprot:5175024-Pyramimonas_sp.AAC.1
MLRASANRGLRGALGLTLRARAADLNARNNGVSSDEDQWLCVAHCPMRCAMCVAVETLRWRHYVAVKTRRRPQLMC